MNTFDLTSQAADDAAAFPDDLQMARACREGSDYERSLEFYRRAWENAAPDSPAREASHVEMGMVLGFMGCFDESLSWLRESAQLFPASPLAHLTLGKTLLMLGEYDAARLPLEQAAALDEPKGSAREEAVRQLSLLRQHGH